MQFFVRVQQMLIRFRYPVSLPQDIADALGISLNNSMNFDALLTSCQNSAPTTLTKFMPRLEAEKFFHDAQRKDRFTQMSLYSYFFIEGWLEFDLQYDDSFRLRRLYIHHKQISDPRGIELQLAIDPHGLSHTSHDASDSLYIA